MCTAIVGFLRECLASDCRRGTHDQPREPERDGARLGAPPAAQEQAAVPAAPSELSLAELVAAVEAEDPTALDAYEAVLKSCFVGSAPVELQRTVALALDEYLGALAPESPRRAGFAAPAVAGWLRKWLLHSTHEQTQEAVADAVGAMARGLEPAAAERLASGLLTVALNVSVISPFLLNASTFGAKRALRGRAVG